MALFSRSVLMGRGKIKILLVFWFLVSVIMATVFAVSQEKEKREMEEKNIKLPQYKTTGKISVEETLKKRRSVRKFTDASISIEEISQLLWAAYGFTASDGRKTTPSAGATYPLEIYIAVRKADKLKPGLYRYLPESHSLKFIKEGDILSQVSETTYQPEMCKSAPVHIIITAVIERTTSVYGQRGIRYIHMEAGHSAQNISLQGVALNIGSVLVGAFEDEKLSRVLEAGKDEIPLYIIPVGKTEKYK
ncbi:MAG: SagB/ThcOx family dehydrogenase [Deltaproteobacteria bacterium]|nr:SagB/ThcOx family dehydrogenase [Deltaproteobacteria bacterium]